MEKIVVGVRFRIEKRGDGGKSEGDGMVEVKVKFGEDW